MVEIKHFDEGQHERMAIIGEVDASSSIELDNAMKKALDAKDKNVMIDCTSLEYISSAGLGVFMSYLDEVKEKNINLVFYGLNPKVMNVFKILGLDQLLNIEETHEAAKAALNEA